MSTLVISEEQYNRIFLKSKNTLVVTEAQYKRIVLGEQGMDIKFDIQHNPEYVQHKNQRAIESAEERKNRCPNKKAKYGVLEKTYYKGEKLISNVCGGATDSFWDEGALAKWTTKLEDCTKNMETAIDLDIGWTEKKMTTTKTYKIVGPFMTNTRMKKELGKGDGAVTWFIYRIVNNTNNLLWVGFDEQKLQWGTTPQELILRAGLSSDAKLDTQEMHDWTRGHRKNRVLQPKGEEGDDVFLIIGLDANNLFGDGNRIEKNISISSGEISGIYHKNPRYNYKLFDDGNWYKVDKINNPKVEGLSKEIRALEKDLLDMYGHWGRNIRSLSPHIGMDKSSYEEYRESMTKLNKMEKQYEAETSQMGKELDERPKSRDENGKLLPHVELKNPQDLIDSIETNKLTPMFSVKTHDVMDFWWDGAQLCEKAKKEIYKESNDYVTSFWTHTALDVLAIGALFIPYVGWAVSMGLEALNGAIYIAEGNKTIGAISIGLALIPGIGPLRRSVANPKVLKQFDKVLSGVIQTSTKQGGKVHKNTIINALKKEFNVKTKAELNQNLVKMVDLFVKADAASLKKGLTLINRNRNRFVQFTKKGNQETFEKYMKKHGDDLHKAFRDWIWKEARKEGLITGSIYGGILYFADEIADVIAPVIEYFMQDATEDQKDIVNDATEKGLKDVVEGAGKEGFDPEGLPEMINLFNETMKLINGNDNSTKEEEEKIIRAIIKSVDFNDIKGQGVEKVREINAKLKSDLEKGKDALPAEIDATRKTEGKNIEKTEQNNIKTQGVEIPSNDKWGYKYYETFYFTKKKGEDKEDTQGGKVDDSTWVLIVGKKANENLDNRFIDAGNQPITDGQYLAAISDHLIK